jgi:hypothetical protein
VPVNSPGCPDTMPLLPGKLPPALLQRLLRFRGAPDRRVVLGPAFGEDAAVIDLGSVYLILKSDPVTFTAAEVGWYAVHVNANDIAVMGARPAWFQATIIVPPRTAPTVVPQIFRDIDRSARSLAIAVTGGHTEVSAAVRQPIVAGDMQGVVGHDGLVTSAGARIGDAIIMTKSAGIEGTSIIARGYARETRRILGASAQRRAARFHHRPGISVVAEALLAARSGALRAGNGVRQTARRRPRSHSGPQLHGALVRALRTASVRADRFRRPLDDCTGASGRHAVACARPPAHPGDLDRLRRAWARCRGSARRQTSAFRMVTAG